MWSNSAAGNYSRAVQETGWNLERTIIDTFEEQRFLILELLLLSKNQMVGLDAWTDGRIEASILMISKVPS